MRFCLLKKAWLNCEVQTTDAFFCSNKIFCVVVLDNLSLAAPVINKNEIKG